MLCSHSPSHLHPAASIIAEGRQNQTSALCDRESVCVCVCVSACVSLCLCLSLSLSLFLCLSLSLSLSPSASLVCLGVAMEVREGMLAAKSSLEPLFAASSKVLGRGDHRYVEAPCPSSTFQGSAGNLSRRPPLLSFRREARGPGSRRAPAPKPPTSQKEAGTRPPLESGPLAPFPSRAGGAGRKGPGSKGRRGPFRLEGGWGSWLVVFFGL